MPILEVGYDTEAGFNLVESGKLMKHWGNFSYFDVFQVSQIAFQERLG